MSPFISRIIAGLCLSALGISMTMKTEWFFRMIGVIPWAERTFGGGGTRFFYKLVGIFLTLLGFIVMTNLTDRIFGPILRTFFRY